MTNIDIRHGDCLAILRELPDDSVDSIVTDPPYGLSNTKPKQVADVLAAWVTGNTEAVPAKKGGFMGKDWDSFVPPPAVWAECLRVLKPGGHMAVFAGARTQDLMGLSIRLAGFEIRDSLGWVYGSGFPKSMDVSKAIDKAAGAERTERTGVKPGHEEFVGRDHLASLRESSVLSGEGGFARPWMSDPEKVEASHWEFAPATPEAERWDGWGTNLKPAIEPIVLARKPLVGTVANNVLTYGVGGLNIDASRVPHGDEVDLQAQQRQQSDGGDSTTRAFGAGGLVGSSIPTYKPGGRFPANVLLDEHAAKEMDRQSGNVNGVVGMKKVSGGHNFNIGEHTPQKFPKSSERTKDSGGASRFFPVFKYQPKAPKKERPVIVREDGSKIQHPTVKPLALMEWLVTLITPEGGTTLDPFAGSGTTLEAARDKGFRAIGIEQEAEYIQLIEARLSKN